MFGRSWSRHLTDDVAGELLRLGSASIFVVEHAPNGFDPGDVSCTFAPRPALGDEWDALPSGFVQDNPLSVVQTAIDRRVAELDADPTKWNGTKLAPVRVHVGRRSGGRQEIPTVDLHFAATDHATFLELTTRWEAFIAASGWSAGSDWLRSAQPSLSHSFGLNATLETCDGRLVLARRGGWTDSYHGARHIAVNEGMDDRDVDGRRPSLLACLRRGAQEELGIEIPATSVVLHTLTLTFSVYQWGMLGHIDLRDSDVSFRTLIDLRQAGQATDDHEQAELFSIPFEPDAVHELLTQPVPWVPWGALNLVLSTSLRFPSESRRLFTALTDGSTRFPMFQQPA